MAVSQERPSAGGAYVNFMTDEATNGCRRPTGATTRASERPSTPTTRKTCSESTRTSRQRGAHEGGQHEANIRC